MNLIYKSILFLAVISFNSAFAFEAKDVSFATCVHESMQEYSDFYSDALAALPKASPEQEALLSKQNSFLKRLIQNLSDYTHAGVKFNNRVYTLASEDSLFGDKVYSGYGLNTLERKVLLQTLNLESMLALKNATIHDRALAIVLLRAKSFPKSFSETTQEVLTFSHNKKRIFSESIRDALSSLPEDANVLSLLLETSLIQINSMICYNSLSDTFLPRKNNLPVPARFTGPDTTFTLPTHTRKSTQFQ